MALRAQIENIVSQMTLPRSFLYGDVNELNNLADGLPVGSPYVFMYSLQPLTSKFTNNNSINNTYSIYLEFLWKIEFDTYTAQCEPYDVLAIQSINEFLVRIKNYREASGQKYFLVDVNDKCSNQQVFNKYDVNTVGRNLTIDLRTTYNDELCFSPVIQPPL